MSLRGKSIAILKQLAGSRLSLDRLPPAWDTGRISIYQFVSSFPSESALPRESDTLPDEEKFYSGKHDIRYVPGAFDGIYFSGSDEKAAAIMSNLSDLCDQPTKVKLLSFYELLLEDNTTNTFDPLLSLIRNSELNADSILSIGKWLAMESPDRQPVKFGIALMGMINNVPKEPLIALGRHEEFTVYVAFALANAVSAEDYDQTLWQLAKQVSGWGRVSIVERLGQTEDTAIKAWLVRTGYQNSVMHEYTAYPCAVGGDLERELSAAHPDAALLFGAGEIIEALICGVPAQGIADYADGAAVVRLYVDHIDAATSASVSALKALQTIQNFLTDKDADWPRLATTGWTEVVRAEIAARVSDAISNKKWLPLVRNGLEAEDDQTFWVAAAVSHLVSIDPWEHRFHRQKSRKSDQWYYLMQSSDLARISQVIDLAIMQLSPETLATGPALENGAGQDYRRHSAIGFVLQELDRFPGLGWPVIDAGLRSPVVRNRIQALRSLGAWEQATWPKTAHSSLEVALSKEPHDELRTNMQRVLSGLPCQEAAVRLDS